MVISADDFLRNRPLPIIDETSNDIGQAHRHTNELVHPTDVEDTSGDVNVLKEAISSPDSIQGSLRRSDEENRCQESALRLLDASARSSGALRERLQTKDFNDDVIDVVINRLLALGILDDEAYAKSAVRYCLSRRMGEIGTYQELRRKGVETHIARKAVDDAREDGAFIESAYALVEYVARRTRGLDKQVRLRRLWSAAGRKGHSSDLIKQAQYDVFTAEEFDEG
ncbi:regulatory protein RecX [Alloscardovia theropitheci]|uniref:Regulatory protein RecX n=1 Tax=Alloscardovia theropitheci TaxID=2496842 RepID=A0A4R0QR66_9BIFI|nr:regulatory protein RecX [Alloscardovia theropitheci]TCD54843.1 regulatory protein RecX [Alloscardovia theropitheci]